MTTITDTGYGPITDVEHDALVAQLLGEVGEAEADVDRITSEAEHRTTSHDALMGLARRRVTADVDLTHQDLDGMTVFTGVIS